MSDPNRPCPDAAHSLTCEACTEFLLDYVDGVLPDEQRSRFESHIAFCRDCEVYLANYTKAAELARASGRPVDAALPEPVPKALVDAILRARRRDV